MSDYAQQIATQLVDQARYDSRRTNPPTDIDWHAVIVKGVHAGYGYGFGVRASEVGK